jgi:DNA-binding protein H-NS
MKGSRGRKKAASSKLAGRKVVPKCRNSSDNTRTWTGRGRMPVWAAELYEEGKLEKALIKQ